MAEQAAAPQQLAPNDMSYTDTHREMVSTATDLCLLRGGGDEGVVQCPCSAPPAAAARETRPSRRLSRRLPLIPTGLNAAQCVYWYQNMRGRR